MNTTAALRKRADAALTDRAQAAAEKAGLGSWERSLRINRHHDAVWMITGIVATFAAPWPFIGVAIFSPSLGWNELLTLCAGLAVLALGLLILTFVVMQKRLGIGSVHFFESGLVLERTRSKILAAPYDGIRPEYLTWMENTNDAPRSRTHLRITMPQNEVAIIDAGNDAEGEEMSWMAQHLGLPPTPRVIEDPRHPHPMW